MQGVSPVQSRGGYRTAVQQKPEPTRSGRAWTAQGRGCVRLPTRRAQCRSAEAQMALRGEAADGPGRSVPGAYPAAASHAVRAKVAVSGSASPSGIARQAPDAAQSLWAVFTSRRPVTTALWITGERQPRAREGTWAPGISAGEGVSGLLLAPLSLGLRGVCVK